MTNDTTATLPAPETDDTMAATRVPEAGGPA
jgi:hypothetical protein